MNEREYPQRKTPRLQGYDYAQEGAYFVTICTYERVPLFGDVVEGQMRLSALGKIADDLWGTISEHRANVILDDHIVMPNHVHGILFIIEPNSVQPPVGMRRASSAEFISSSLSKGAKRGTLSTIIGAYKSAVTRTINSQMGLRAPIVWQDSFHDHIIRNEHSLNHIREYVQNNPARWAEDSFYTGT